MATGLGVLGKCGIKEGSTWAAGWSAVDTMVPFTDESITQTIGQIEDMALEGTAAKRKAGLGLVELSGSLSGQLDYSNWASIIEAAMGAESDGVYTFETDLDEILEFEFEKTVSRWRISHAKINRMVIEGAKGEALTVSIDIIGKTPTRSATAFPSISLSSRSLVRFSNTATTSYIRIGNQDDALTSSDNQSAEAFRLEINNNLKADDGDNQTRYILEPKRNGKREVSFYVKLPRYTADTFHDWKDAGTPLQAICYFTDGTTYFQIEVPEMIFYEGFNSNIAGPGVIFQEGTATCFLNSSNTPLTAITNEARLTIGTL